MSQLGWHRRRKSLGSSGSENIRSESSAIDGDKAGCFFGLGCIDRDNEWRQDYWTMGLSAIAKCLSEL